MKEKVYCNGGRVFFFSHVLFFYLTLLITKKKLLSTLLQILTPTSIKIKLEFKKRKDRFASAGEVKSQFYNL